jgi:hypothetical protein
MLCNKCRIKSLARALVPGVFLCSLPVKLTEHLPEQAPGLNNGYDIIYLTLNKLTTDN